MSNELQSATPPPARIMVQDHSDHSGLMDTAKFEHLQRVAKVFAASTMLPTHYQNNVANCVIGLHLAIRLGADPLLVMQKTYIIHGRPAMEAQLAIGLANSSSAFSSRIHYRMEGEGDTRQCTAVATMADTGEEVTEIISVSTAKKMGWWAKKDSLWPKATDLMLKYRSAMWLVRTNAPEVLMGLLSKEEAQELDAIDAESTPVSEGLVPLAAQSPTPIPDTAATPQSDPSTGPAKKQGPKKRARKEEAPTEPDADLPDQKPLLAGYMKEFGEVKSVNDAKEILARATVDDKLSEVSHWEICRWGEERIDGIKSKRGERSNT